MQTLAVISDDSIMNGNNIYLQNAAKQGIRIGHNLLHIVQSEFQEKKRSVYVWEVIMKYVRTVALLVLFVQGLTACSGSDSMNKIVQNGGTILLSLGAHEELGHVNLSNTNLTAKMIDSSGGQANVKVREVFPLNVDKTSAINHSDTPDGDSYSGFWFAAIDLVDPGTGIATSLASGDATLEIKGLAATQTRLIKILPGPGAVNPIMTFGSINTLNLLKPATQVKYVVSDPQKVFTEQNLLGGLEFQFQYAAASVNGLAPSVWPRAVSSTNNENLQIQSYTTSGAGTNTLHVVILNPAGIGQVSSANATTQQFYQVSRMKAVRFSIVYPPQVGASAFANASGVTGYSLDGNIANVSALGIAKL